mgnify:CR=1 FL=1
MIFVQAMMLLVLLVGGAIAAVVSFLVLLPITLAIKPQGPNRYGRESATRTLRAAIAGGVRRSFDFSGRANRLDFWAFAVTVAVLCGLAFVTFVALVIIWGDNTSLWLAAPLLVIPALAVPSLSMAVRRLHDVNRSGWWLLVLFVAGILILFYWFVQPSQSEAKERAAVFT